MSARKASVFLRVMVLLGVVVTGMAWPIGGAVAAPDAPAGKALQFNGTNQYVTFGDTRYKEGALSGSPTWNSTANSKLGGSSLTFNGSSQYVTTGTGTAFNSATFTVETRYMPRMIPSSPPAGRLNLPDWSGGGLRTERRFRVVGRGAGARATVATP